MAHVLRSSTDLFRDSCSLGFGISGKALTKEEPGNSWIKTGAHVMIVGSGAKMLDGYPGDAKGRPNEALRHVAWHAVRAFYAAGPLISRSLRPHRRAAVIDLALACSPKSSGLTAKPTPARCARLRQVRSNYAPLSVGPTRLAVCLGIILPRFYLVAAIVRLYSRRRGSRQSVIPRLHRARDPDQCLYPSSTKASVGSGS